jgi:carboxyl-terminal processing protease
MEKDPSVMKSKYLLLLYIAFIISLFPACSDSQDNGILGIEVPIGKEKVSEKTPYIITGVYEGSPAHIAGIKPGDRIMQINNMPIRDGMKFEDIFSAHLTGKAGTRVTIYVKRGTEDLIFDVIRAKR